VSRAVIIRERSAAGRAATNGRRESADFVLDGDKRLANIAAHEARRSMGVGGWVVATAAAAAAAAAAATAAVGRTGVAGGAFCPTATATTHDRGGYGRPGRDIELVARGGRATSIDSSAPETKARRSSPPHPTAAAAAAAATAATDAGSFAHLPPSDEREPSAAALAMVEAEPTGVEVNATAALQRNDTNTRDTTRRDDMTHACTCDRHGCYVLVLRSIANLFDKENKRVRYSYRFLSYELRA